mmetsp:Transcript_1707/g.3693  ORF Transcript_1707/g.3693 Transcript_1707/m.3693 type:complete len:952 (-) Transcript_1707:649-3504(-)
MASTSALHQQQQECPPLMLSMTVGGDSQTEPSLLIHNNPVLMAEILSHVLTTTKEFARLRRVCKSWKNEILPYFLEHHSHHYPTPADYGRHNPFFLKVCYDDDDLDDDSSDDDLLPNTNAAEIFAATYRQPIAQRLTSPKFLPELVNLANHHRSAGKRYDDLDVWQDIVMCGDQCPHTLDFWESVQCQHSERWEGGDDVSVQSMLIVSEAIPSTYIISPQRIVDQRLENHNFASLCRALTETDSWPQFCSLGEEALNEGMFLSMEDYDTMASSRTTTKAANNNNEEEEGGSFFAFESRIVPVIFTVRFRLLDDGPSSSCNEHDYHDSQDRHPFANEVCFQVRIPKPTFDEDDDDDTRDMENDSEHSTVPNHHEVENTTGTDQDANVVGDSQQRNRSIAPFVKYLSLDDNDKENDSDNNDDPRYAYARFKGYNAQQQSVVVAADNDIPLDKHEEEADGEATLSQKYHYYTCHVPMSFAWWELMQLLIPDEHYREQEDGTCGGGLEDQGADSFLPLDWLWRRFQEQSVQEGVGIMDGLQLLLATTTSSSDHHRQTQLLMQQLDAVAAANVASTAANSHFSRNRSFRQWQDRRPAAAEEGEPSTHHIAGRTALVDPDLYAYSERHSTLNGLSVLEVPPCSFPYSHYHHHLGPPILQTVDYWGRSYNGSIEYQWLPTYFDVDPDGKSTTIRDYINNLIPRSEYAALYDSLAHLFSLALPLLESVYSYCRVVKRSHVRMVESNQQTWHPLPPSPLKEEPTLLRGQSLQVITEIVEYDLNAIDTSMEESWHVKGMPHEEIVATAMYVLPVDENHHGRVGTIQFRRAFFNDEANYLFSTIDRDRPSEVEADVHAGLLPLGQADIIPGRLLVFPNCHVSKMSLRKQETTGGPTQKLRLIVFYLVNPEKRIISTREVGTQQGYAPPGTISREQARVHRTELRRERENAIPDWNVRQIHLL